MKKWICLLFVALFMLVVDAGRTSAAAPQQPVPVPKLYLNGLELQSEAPPEIVNSSVLVPARIVTESLGFKVDYDSKLRQVTVKDDHLQVKMRLNDPKATVGDKEVTLVEPPILRADRTMIPVRFVSETFGLDVFWDHPTKSVFLYSSVVEPEQDDEQNDEQADEDAANEPGLDDNEDPATGGDLVGVVDEQRPDAEDHHSGEAHDGGEPSNIVRGFLQRIQYEPDYLVITYEGKLTPLFHTVSDPNRIVIDFPNADYAEQFTAGIYARAGEEKQPDIIGAPAPGEIPEIIIQNHEALEKIRYSRYTSNPKSVRVVLDLNQAWGYQVVPAPIPGTFIVQLKETKTPPKPSYIVVLDAGHGGQDPGARSISGKWEKDFNLSVVKKVQAILQNEPRIQLLMTRDDDTYPSLDDRVNLSNSMEADLFLSVHGNSYKPGTNGTETYYYRDDSVAFAKLLHKHTVAATGFKDNHVRKANYKVIRETTMPAVLLEVGYLSYEQNERLMFNDAFQDKVAKAIADAIKQYLDLDH